MKTSNITTEWDLSLLYDGDAEELAQKDVDIAKEEYAKFADMYREDKSFLKDPAALKEALEELENLGGEINLSRPIIYYSYKKSLDSSDQQAEQKVNQLSQTYSKLANEIRFFELELGEIPEHKQEEFLAADELEHYHKYLTWLFKEARYHLDEAAENVLSVTRLPRHDMWVDGVEKVLTQKSVQWEGEDLPLPKALNKLHDLPTDERRELHNLTMDSLKELANFSESELNAVITNKKIVDELRGYESPQQSMVMSNENTVEEVEVLAQTVTDNFDVVGDFYDIKKELLGVGTLTYADRQASVGELDREFSYEKACKIVYESYQGLDEEFGDIFMRMVSGGQVDVYPREGKSGGAFCSGTEKNPTFVLLNFVENFNSVNTLAHEFGHAVHFEMSKEQSPIYDNVTLATAETGSTFFEKVMFEHLYNQLSNDDKIIALHDKIQGKVSTIFRQIAGYNFEKGLHAQIREQGSLSHEQIAELMNQHMDSYLGDNFQLSERDGYFYVTWSHIRRPFYVYTYSYGDLISSALYQRVQEDEGYIAEIKQFLRAGTSKSPAEIFADIGIDTSSTDVFEQGIADVREDIAKLRKLVDEQ